MAAFTPCELFRRVLSGGQGDGFDLDELIGPAERGNTEQRAGRVVITAGEYV